MSGMNPLQLAVAYRVYHSSVRRSAQGCCDGWDPRATLAGCRLRSDLCSHMMGSSQIRWKQERSNMMAMELADPVETTKLLVFMCVDSPSPWGEMEPSGARIRRTTLLPSQIGGWIGATTPDPEGRGAHLAKLRAHADAGCPSGSQN
jgi:hypothetical protein